MIGQRVLVNGTVYALAVESDENDAYVWCDIDGELIRFHRSALSVIA